MNVIGSALSFQPGAVVGLTMNLLTTAELISWAGHQVHMP